MNQQPAPTPQDQTATPDFQHAWDLVSGQLRLSMPQAMYDAWVTPLRPLDYQDHTYTLGAVNAYARDWVESRLKSTITRQLEGVLNDTLTLKVEVMGAGKAHRNAEAEPAGSTDEEGTAAPQKRTRKVMLQRAYGSRRAAVIQPERGMFVTLYFFNAWLPRVGHSAMAVILAARAMCYWNPMTGELRNTVDTEMSELAKRAAVSVRTVKDVLNSEDVRRYFLRYRVRRVMTSNGVRTAGITLHVRMDDPLTPDDQESYGLPEDENWYSPEFASLLGEDED